jgi:ABC-type Fe3+-hydroxamate transport system, periplasmic component
MSKVSVKLVALALTIIVIAAGVIVISFSQESVRDHNGVNVITDMRGVEVEVPENPSRVAIIDRGFIAQALVALGVEDKVVATGGLIGATIPPSTNTRDTLLLNEKYCELPNFGYPGYLAFNMEIFIDSNPDLVIWKQTINGSTSPDAAAIMNVITNIVKVPLFVLLEPGYDGTPPKLDTTYDSIELLGKIFKKEERADEVLSLLKGKIGEITHLTASLSTEQKSTVMILGLASEGSGAYAYGSNYTHGLYIEEIAGVNNLVNDYTNQIINIEGIISLNPDMIVLVDGPINPILDTIYNDSRFSAWKVLDAIKNGNVCSIGQLAWWGEHMMNFPSILMIVAKQAHPDLFNDIDLTNWIKEYEMELYGKTSEEALDLMYSEKLYWNNLIPGP